jgi:hypothetical protein
VDSLLLLESDRTEAHISWDAHHLLSGEYHRPRFTILFTVLFQLSELLLFLFNEIFFTHFMLVVQFLDLILQSLDLVDIVAFDV